MIPCDLSTPLSPSSQVQIQTINVFLLSTSSRPQPYLQPASPRTMKLFTLALPAFLATGVLAIALPQPNPDLVVIETVIHDDEQPGRLMLNSLTKGDVHSAYYFPYLIRIRIRQARCGTAGDSVLGRNRYEACRAATSTTFLPSHILFWSHEANCGLSSDMCLGGRILYIWCFLLCTLSVHSSFARFWSLCKVLKGE